MKLYFSLSSPCRLGGNERGGRRRKKKLYFGLFLFSCSKLLETQGIFNWTLILYVYHELIANRVLCKSFAPSPVAAFLYVTSSNTIVSFAFCSQVSSLCRPPIFDCRLSPRPSGEMPPGWGDTKRQMEAKKGWQERGEFMCVWQWGADAADADADADFHDSREPDKKATKRTGTTRRGKREKEPPFFTCGVAKQVSHRKLGLSCVYFGDHITTEYNMYYATYCIFFSLFLTRAR